MAEIELIKHQIDQHKAQLDVYKSSIEHLNKDIILHNSMLFNKKTQILFLKKRYLITSFGEFRVIKNELSFIESILNKLRAEKKQIEFAAEECKKSLQIYEEKLILLTKEPENLIKVDFRNKLWTNQKS